MGARAVLVGDNFRFGYRQAGDVRTLQELGARLGFAVEIVAAVRFRGQVVSSSGDPRADLCRPGGAGRRLLGRPYALEGRVVTGRGVGSKQTVPTLNLETEAEVIPARGVYRDARQRHGCGDQHRLPANFRRERPAFHRDVPLGRSRGMPWPATKPGLRSSFWRACARSASSIRRKR